MSDLVFHLVVQQGNYSLYQLDGTVDNAPLVLSYLHVSASDSTQSSPSLLTFEESWKTFGCYLFSKKLTDTSLSDLATLLKLVTVLPSQLNVAWLRTSSEQQEYTLIKGPKIQGNHYTAQIINGVIGPFANLTLTLGSSATLSFIPSSKELTINGESILLDTRESKHSESCSL